MLRKPLLTVLLIVALASAACQLSGAANPTPSPFVETLPTSTFSFPTPSTAPTNTPMAATVTPTLLPAGVTSAPTTSPTDESPVPLPTAAVQPSSPDAANYIDDRSTPAQLVVSFINALNRHEYVRAYSYWENPADALGAYAAWAAGYQDTASVNLVFGQISGDAGAGQMYYSVPALLEITKTDSSQATMSACYILHQSNPYFFGDPPFEPLGISQGQAAPAESRKSDSDLLGTACSGMPTGSQPVAVEGASLAIDKSNYLDNRSGALETVSSLLNALNVKEYVRAYSYFDNPASYPGAFDAYAAGFANTELITATFGTLKDGIAAGNLYYKLPLAMEVLTSSGAHQLFVGCYSLHLGQPVVQGTPPFVPMGITAGTFKLVTSANEFKPPSADTCK